MHAYLQIMMRTLSLPLKKSEEGQKNFETWLIWRKWSVRLGVRTPGFHPGNRGSIPLRTTIKAFYNM
jgi:hypothetical protein